MSSSAFISLLRHPRPFSNRNQHRNANLARSSAGGGPHSVVFPTSLSLPSPPPPAIPFLAGQHQSRSETVGPVSQAPRGEDGSGVARREAIGLGVCLNAFAFFFRGAAGEHEAGAAPAEGGQCSLTVAPSGLAFCDRLLGVGAAAARGQLIKAHYVGKLEDGKVFDSSYSRGRPLTFRVGVGEVIKGWDQGILGDEGIPPMLSGGKRILRIPPELAYGMRGAGCKGGSCIIPPDSTLFFDVEFIGKA